MRGFRVNFRTHGSLVSSINPVDKMPSIRCLLTSSENNGVLFFGSIYFSNRLKGKTQTTQQKQQHVYFMNENTLFSIYFGLFSNECFKVLRQTTICFHLKFICCQSWTAPLITLPIFGLPPVGRILSFTSPFPLFQFRNSYTTCGLAM